MGSSSKPKGIPFIWLLIIVAAGFLFYSFYLKNTQDVEEVPLSQVVAQIRAGAVTSIRVEGNRLYVELQNGGAFASLKAPESTLPEQLQSLGVTTEQLANIKIEYASPTDWSTLLSAGGSVLLILVMLIGGYVMLRQFQGANNQALAFGKSRARMYTGDQPSVTFDDVAGVDEAKEELREVVEFLKEPEKFVQLGARIPKGVLLVGAPGTGKTLMAKAVSGEAGVPFFSISGSEFVEMFVGVGASRVRDLFDQAKRHSPCLTGDAMIALADGRQLPIQEMYDRRMVGVQVPAMTEDFQIVTATVVGVTRRRPEDLYRIVTSHSQIKATGNHLLPILRDGRMVWVRADEVKVGERIAAPRHLNVSTPDPAILDFMPDEARVHLRGNGRQGKYPRLGELRGSLDVKEIEQVAIGHGGFTDSILTKLPAHVTPDLAYICGLIAADGCFDTNPARTIQFINTETRLHERLSTIVEEHFGYAPRRHLNVKRYETILPQGKPPQSLRDCYTTYISHSLLCQTLRAIDAHILEFPEEHVAAWLRGVFDGDGSVRAGDHCSQIVISCFDPEKNAKIRNALLRVGIPTTRSARCHTGEEGNIVITGRDHMRTFVEKIGSEHPEKAAKLSRLDLDGPSASRFDGIPVGSLLREARRSIGMGQRAFVDNGRYLGHYVSQYERGLVTPSRVHLQMVVDMMYRWCAEQGKEATAEVVALRNLAYGDVLWTRIERVERLEPEEYVYDLVLDEHHNFVANHAFVHNCIVFLDEIDAVGRHRGAGLGGSHDEREQTLNQILVEMDGFDTDTNVIVMAATNRPDILDPALLRPGRFDRRVVLDRPDIKGREAILKVHVRGKPLGEDVDLSTLAKSIPGFVGADIENLVNEAAILAARRNKKVIEMAEFEEAIERVLAGPERKSRLMSDEEKRITAYHEAGHAVVAHVLPKCDPVHKVSIVARGMAGGYTMALPEEDRRLLSKAKFEDDLAFWLGGRAAEELVFGDVTTGAANDLERVTEVARAMVTRFGMSEKLGPMTFGQKEELVFLGKEIGEQRDYGEAVAQEIDEEVRRIVREAYERAKGVLTQYREQFERIAERLIEVETLEAEEFVALFEGTSRSEPETPESPAPVSGVKRPAARPAAGRRKSALDRPPAPVPA